MTTQINCGPHTHAHTHTQTHTPTHKYKQKNKHKYKCTHVHTHTHTHANTQPLALPHTHTNTNTNTNTIILTRTHTHIHKHTHTLAQQQNYSSTPSNNHTSRTLGQSISNVTAMTTQYCSQRTGFFGEKDFSECATNRIFRILRREHHKRATITQPSLTSIPVIQRQCTLCDKCCCILPGIYTALGFQHYPPHLRRVRLAPSPPTSCKFPRYFVHPTMCFACRMR